jgi:hypothetical protein
VHLTVTTPLAVSFCMAQQLQQRQGTRYIGQGRTVV